MIDTLPMLSALLVIAALGLRARRRMLWLRAMERADAMADQLSRAA
jgi:hypothetical protein